ncbi:ABC transporter ATP-binding protein [Elusimicrobiota bacterium]
MIRKTDRAEIDKRVKEAADILGLERLLEKRPKELSGGQRQRVAVGRAIVRRPKVFLFDEPLSNLDAKLRTQMRAEISRLHRRLKATTVYVTHDQAEAMTMADRIVVLHGGVVQQCGRPLEVYSKPVNVFVAAFIGSPPMNLMDARCGEEEDGLHLRAGEIDLRLPSGLAEKLRNRKMEEFRLGVRPEDIYLEDRKPAGLAFGGGFDCEVELAESLGNEVCLHCRAGDLEFLSTQKHDFEIRVGQRLKMAFALDKLHVFDKDGNRVPGT